MSSQKTRTYPELQLFLICCTDEPKMHRWGHKAAGDKYKPGECIHIFFKIMNS